jgi:hypothetical protein
LTTFSGFSLRELVPPQNQSNLPPVNEHRIINLKPFRTNGRAKQRRPNRRAKLSKDARQKLMQNETFKEMKYESMALLHEMWKEYVQTSLRNVDISQLQVGQSQCISML